MIDQSIREKFIVQATWLIGDVEVELRPIEDEIKKFEMGLYNMGLAARGEEPLRRRIIDRAVQGYGDTFESALAEALTVWENRHTPPGGDE